MELMKLGELRANHEEDIVEVVKILKNNGFSVVDEDIDSEYKRFHIMKDNGHEKKPNKPVKKPWSDWSLAHELTFMDIKGNEKTIKYQYRDNGKRVQIRSGALKAGSSCYDEDEFSLSRGLELAEMRLVTKYLDNQVKAIAKAM